MNELALFAGNGGGILGAKLLGWRTVCAVEIERYRCERLAQRQNEGFLPPFPIWCGDITAFDGKPWRGIVDVVSGGFPCQDISAANPHAEGITGARSGLWKEMLRIIREVGSDHVLVENSPMLAGRGLGVVLSDLAALGYDAQWGVLGADDLYGFHQRKRLFIAGHTNQAGLERLAGDGNADGGPDKAGHSAKAGLRVLADRGLIARRVELEQQIGEGKGARKQSGRRDTDRELADANEGERPRERLPIQPGQPLQENVDAGGTCEGRELGDCLWLDREILTCKDGKLRATKPGLCGMADGVANRMERLSAIGDGQVPVVVAAAWRTLTNTL